MDSPWMVLLGACVLGAIAALATGIAARRSGRAALTLGPSMVCALVTGAGLAAHAERSGVVRAVSGEPAATIAQAAPIPGGWWIISAPVVAMGLVSGVLLLRRNVGALPGFGEAASAAGAGLVALMVCAADRLQLVNAQLILLGAIALVWRRWPEADTGTMRGSGALLGLAAVPAAFASGIALWAAGQNDQTAAVSRVAMVLLCGAAMLPCVASGARATPVWAATVSASLGLALASGLHALLLITIVTGQAWTAGDSSWWLLPADILASAPATFGHGAAAPEAAALALIGLACMVLGHRASRQTPAAREEARSASRVLGAAMIVGALIAAAMRVL